MIDSKVKLICLLGIFIVASIGFISFLLSSIFFPCRSIKPLPQAQFPPIKVEPLQLQQSLISHVETLAHTIGERNSYNLKNLYEAAGYIKDFWGRAGFGIEVQPYVFQRTPFQNIWVQIDGKQKPEEVILVGAHYDSVAGSPGADDNASGVGALLEISKILQAIKPLRRSVRFVAFVNEEPPFFKSSDMGSRVYAREVARNKEQIVAMISLESIGYFVDEPASQHYPPLFNLFYPDKGNFLGIVGNFESRDLIKRVTNYFREGSDLPCECIAAPRFIMGVDWSDHASFWEYGYQAVMVTDTVPYRNPHYHQPTDTSSTLDYPKYAEGTVGLANAIYRLANE